MHFVCALLKVVSHYYLSALSISVMGFQKKKLDSGGRVDEWGEIYPVFLLIFGIVLILQPLKLRSDRLLPDNHVG